MPSYPHIERYHADLQRLVEFGGSDNEQSIRRAFAVCLDSYCRDHRDKLALIDELSAGPNIPDGTVKDALRMARGYWEAKDTHDDLDAEIQAKFNRGYPRDNIVFEDSETAVLFQNGAQAMRVDMTRPGELHRLISRFLDYELPEIEEFRQARQQFKTDLPAVLENLRETVAEAEAGNPEYRVAADGFLELCRRSISPDVSDADVREMLLQHILTEEIFLSIFSNVQFHRENNVARQLDGLARTFFTGSVRQEAMDRLRVYYGAIGRAAHDIADYAEKQQFLKAVYEDFYKAYNPAAADRLGVVYTPNEVVDFIIRGTDYLLERHFGKSLAADNVQILDPATGTGTFITGLINHLPPDRLEYKYRHEIHANEVAILPYYIANLNIEYTYKERTGRYLEFPNLCFVDTLDNMDWPGASGGAVTRQGAFNLGGVSEENWIRVQEQNEKSISVIIGNPPYNDQQSNWNDDNPNRKYPQIDDRIRETYIEKGTAQRTHQYDMYKRFIRWASDRLSDNGVIGFVSNSAFLETRQDDGFREVVAQEFSELWAVDLKGNARTSGERRRREGGNVFSDKIRVGVAIYFLVRRKKTEGFKVFYNAVDDYARAHDKIDYIRGKSLEGLPFEEIAPDAKSNWLNQSDSDFEKLPPLANRYTKLAKTTADEQAVFGLYSLGTSTNRDEWVYDFDSDNLGTKVRAFVNKYEEVRAQHGGKVIGHVARGTSIKWTRDLERQLRLDMPNVFSRESVRQSIRRPFVSNWLYFNRQLNEMQYQMPQVFPTGTLGENKAICFPGNATSSGFQVLATDRVFSHDLLKTTQCLPLYRYTPDGERVSNITGWGLRQFREHYGDDTITAEDIFAYTYAMLHDPAYRQRFEIDLRREFPRVYFQEDFHWWAGKGRELLELHLGFETAEPYSLERVDRPDVEPRRAILRADQARGTITLDERTTLAGVPADAFRYQLGSRSALEWVLDQYKERNPRDATIRERFNAYRFADHKERVIDLLRRVCTVSVKTMEVVDDMAYWEDGQLIVFGDRGTSQLPRLSQYF
jgi:predicted helicase